MAITVKSEFWGNNYAFIQDQSSFRKIIARLMSQRENLRDRALINTLLGVVPGSTATSSYKRVSADRLENGGKRTIESVDNVNRATTAGDVTDLKNKIFAYRSQPVTYPVDKATRP